MQSTLSTLRIVLAIAIGTVATGGTSAPSTGLKITKDARCGNGFTCQGSAFWELLQQRTAVPTFALEAFTLKRYQESEVGGALYNKGYRMQRRDYTGSLDPATERSPLINCPVRQTDHSAAAFMLMSTPPLQGPRYHFCALDSQPWDDATIFGNARIPFDVGYERILVATAT
ncbi:uncharacterized protein PpBr36_10884 [Pyricularia pennisetigena]|uniref:uncharacterized protein n=1 Tax=Pyricularia pennisetigena TaxID=1578925 RepID=UPI001153DD7B|nr:uncharacterized protein PpBr36_10884 [Pyricularia pennisetigena]TLS20969.1 hypothetical protein PpBr36_10884 [Pyricularia pennisetigena]